jgi:hypothetical protein
MLGLEPPVVLSMTSCNGGCVAPAQRSRRLALDVSLVTLREGWSQLCGLTGIAQRRLDRCIHSYTHRFRFIAACDGNEDKSYGTEPKDQIHPMQKSQFHRKKYPILNSRSMSPRSVSG